MNSKPTSYFIAVSTCLTLALLTGLVHAQESKQASSNSSQAIIIFDGSGSMWGKVNGEQKINIAKKVVRDLVDGLDNSVELGLMAYGHRKKGDCDDIELLIKPGPLNKKAFIAAVDAIQPKGKTPLTAAVEKAAEVLKYQEQRASVILISDGLETCDRDPCEAAKALAAAGLDFKAHVIGFDLRAEDLEKIECLARNTGGEFLAATDADTLAAALSVAVNKAVEDATPTPTPVPDSTMLKVKTLLTEGGEEIPAQYYIFDPKRDIKGKRKTLHFGSKQEIPLPAGDYVVRAVWGKASVEEPFTLTAGETLEKTFVLGAGALKVNTVLKEGGEEVESYVNIFEPQTDLKGKRKRVTGGTNSKAFELPAGTYLVRAKWGNAEVEETIDVVPGAKTEPTLVLEGGILNFSATASEGGEEVKPYVNIYSAAKDLKGNRKRITGGPNKSFQLPAGKFVLIARWGRAEAEAEAEVKAGEATDVDMVMNAGVLVLNPVIDGQIAEPTPYYNIYMAEKDLKGKPIRIDGGNKSEFILPAGSYTIIVKSNPYRGEATAEVEAGSRIETTIEVEKDSE